MWQTFIKWLDELLYNIVYGYRHTINQDYTLTTIQNMPPDVQNKPVATPIHKSRIQTWAKAIGANEGANPALNNPGNLKLSTLTASWGATKGHQASDGGWLCQFPTQQAGFTALCNFLTLAAEGELIISHPKPCSLQTFTVRYAGNPPQGYIDRIGLALGVPLTTDIATLLC